MESSCVTETPGVSMVSSRSRSWWGRKTAIKSLESPVHTLFINGDELAAELNRICVHGTPPRRKPLLSKKTPSLQNTLTFHNTTGKMSCGPWNKSRSVCKEHTAVRKNHKNTNMNPSSQQRGTIRASVPMDRDSSKFISASYGTSGRIRRSWMMQ